VVDGPGTVTDGGLIAGLRALDFSQAHELSVGDLITINGETRQVASITTSSQVLVNDFTNPIPAGANGWEERDGYIPEYKNYLNKLANSLVYNVNGQHQQGYGLGDATAPQRDFFSETSSAALGITLAVNAAGDTITFSGDMSSNLSVGDTITINGETRMVTTYNPGTLQATVNIPFTGGPVAAGTSFEYVNVQTAATMLQVDGAIASNSGLIAASGLPTDDGFGNPLAVGDNTNALSIAQIVDNQSTVDTNNDGQIDYGSFHEYLHSLHSEIGNAGNTAIYEAESNGAMLNFLENRRDSISAVSLDEEAANLMQFEKSYQALAQFMGKVSGLLDVLMNIV
jgi:flagellar hook-associated protein FlgK